MLGLVPSFFASVIFIALVVAEATAQTPVAEPQSVQQLRAGFGAPKTPLPDPIKPTNQLSNMQLAGIIRRIHEGKPNKNYPDMASRKLSDTWVYGVSLNDAPSDPWIGDQRHFQVISVLVDSAAIEPGFVLIRFWGEIAGADRNLIPVLMQFNKDGKWETAKGRVDPPNEFTNSASFDIIARRIDGATHAMLIFVHPDRTWAMYRDATSGKPRDQLLIVDISEQSLIDLEKGRLAKEQTKAVKMAAAAEKKRRLEVGQAEAERRERDAAEQAEIARVTAIEDSKYRTWTTVDGKYSVIAKFVSFGMGRVTILTRDGRKLTLEMDRLSETDRQFVDQLRKKLRPKSVPRAPSVESRQVPDSQ